MGFEIGMWTVISSEPCLTAAALLLMV